MPKRLKSGKKYNSVSMTDEAWSICEINRQKYGLSRNDYIERCVRKADNEYYNLTIENLISLLSHVRQINSDLDSVRKDLAIQEERILSFLKLLNVSINEIPD